MSDYYPIERPQAIDAETWLLGGILQDPNSIGEVSLILKNGTEFYLEKNCAVWDAIIKLSKEGSPIDVLTVADALEKAGTLNKIGGKDYIFSLMESVTSAANVEYYANIIRGKYILRSLISSSNEIIKESLDPTAITEEVLQFAEKQIYDLAADQIKESALLAGDVANDVLHTLAMRKHGDLAGCPTKFPELDNITNGLQKTDLIILAARPSMGKTSFALNIATNAAMERKTVLFFSLEMSAPQIVIRILSSMSNVSQSKLRFGITDSETTKILLAKAEEMKDMSLFIDDSSIVRAFDLISKCRIFEKKHKKLDLVVVDYLGLMQINGNSENRAVGVGENSRMLKVLAKELQVPVLVLAQLNRKVEDRISGNRPQLSDLRDSGSIEQDADMVWFIHREKDKTKKDGFNSPDFSDDNKRTLIVAKHRNGPTADIELEFDRETTTFRNYKKTQASHPNEEYGFNEFS